MSRKSIRKLEKIFTNEDVRGIKKDNESGKWRLITQTCTRERSHLFSGEVKSGELTESEPLYEVCEPDASEIQFSYQDHEGAEKIVYLKLS